MAKVTKTGATATATATATVAGPFVGKYRKVHGKGSLVAMPGGWGRANATFTIGLQPPAPRNPAKPTVMHAVYNAAQTVAKANGGNVPCAALFAALVSHAWQPHHKTKYTSHGVVCGAWVAGYINGAVRAGYITQS